MTHFGIICPSATGHLNPMTTLGNALRQRGHRVTLFGALDTQYKATLADLEFAAIGEKEFPLGSMRQQLSRLGKNSGISAFLTTMDWVPQWVSCLLREGTQAAKTAGVEALIVDQTSLEGGTIAELLQIPFVNICNIPFYQHPSVPPYWTAWPPGRDPWSQVRNLIGYQIVNALDSPTWRVIQAFRRERGLRRLNLPNEAFSTLAAISQMPAEFDFPRHLPSCFYYTGPYENLKIRETTPFPYEKLTGQPLIYASLGTLQNRLLSVFQCIAQACVGLDVQLVISLGGGFKLEDVPELPGSPLVVEYAPQLALMQHAKMIITHAGMNTTLEALSQGVPLVAIPLATDHPGVGARIAWSGAGETLSLGSLTVARLRSAIVRVLEQESYKANAVRLQRAIQRSGGTTTAVNIIEKVLTLSPSSFSVTGDSCFISS